MFRQPRNFCQESTVSEETDLCCVTSPLVSRAACVCIFCVRACACIHCTSCLPSLVESPNLLNMECLNELDLLPDTPSLSVPDVKPLLLDSSTSCSLPPVMGLPSSQHSYYEPGLGSEANQISFIEQQQVKLRQTQQLQQQKLLELQQTILQAQLLKTKLSLASITVSSSGERGKHAYQHNAHTRAHTHRHRWMWEEC